MKLFSLFTGCKVYSLQSGLESLWSERSVQRVPQNFQTEGHSNEILYFNQTLMGFNPNCQCFKKMLICSWTLRSYCVLHSLSSIGRLKTTLKQTFHRMGNMDKQPSLQHVAEIFQWRQNFLDFCWNCNRFCCAPGSVLISLPEIFKSFLFYGADTQKEFNLVLFKHFE